MPFRPCRRVGPRGRGSVPRVTAALALVLPAAGVLLVSPLAAQERDSLVVVPDSVPIRGGVQIPDVEEGTTPGGAFLRSLLVPGWGQASIGSYTRAGFYVLAEATNAWMLVRTVTRLNDAQRVRDMREAEVAASLAAQGITDPAEVADAQDRDPLVDDARDLVEARSQQFEDWLALGIFTIFLSGADAFVSAHLKDFPEPVRIGFRAGPERAEIGLSISIGGRGSGPR